MGGDHCSTKRRKKKQQDLHHTSSSSPSSSSSASEDTYHVSRRHHRKRSRSPSRTRKDKERRGRRSDRSDRERKHRRLKSRRRERKMRVSDSEASSGDDNSGPERPGYDPQTIIRHVLNQFPGVGPDLLQLLQMVDDGQAIDIKELSERSLVKNLKKLFMSLKLIESGRKVFLLPSNGNPTLEVVGSILRSHVDPKENDDHPISAYEVHSTQPDIPCDTLEENTTATPLVDVTAPAPAPTPTPVRRVIGPEMPSAELLAAAAKLTEAEAELREAEEDAELFIGPPPPAVAAEAASANEAERFEEVTRIVGAEAGSPYDALGVNHNMSPDNIKKRYWKLSLMVHPDKCPHPQAHRAFIILNKAFKDLQDPDKRKELDEKIKLKEEQEKFKIELKAMREAAQWRRSQGISMEGDDELLADMDVKAPPKREEWMTTLPPERKPGVTMQATRFSKGAKEGRGDTSAWTDTPSDRAQKAKMNYLEAYQEAASLASNEGEKKRTGSDADLVDKYNKTSRSKSLVQKHQEETTNQAKRKKSKQHPSEKAEWEGNHPWKPWDREKDLTAGRQRVNLDPENMTQGLTSRFSSGTFQRNFL